VVVLVVAVTGCSRYSFAIRRQYDRGQYGATVARCENQSWTAQSWNRGHQARYHVYCGMAYLNLGDGERAASQLVRAEKMRLEDPRLITGRDLARLSQGLMQLFGVPAGQLEIEERPGGATVEGGIAVGTVVPAPATEPSVTVAPTPAPAPPAVRPGVSFSASAGVNARAQVHIVPPAPIEAEVDAEPPEPPAPPAAPPAPAVEISAQPPAAAPPVIVIPEEDGAVIE
jgi:hypothetical protein